MNNKKRAINGLKWFGKSFLWLIPLLFIIDIVSKRYFEATLWQGYYSKQIVVIPHFFTLEVLHNTGAAWGVFSGQYWLLIAISLIAGVIMIWYLAKNYRKMNWVGKIALYFMIPGCLGNLIDRAFYENGVIDFLKFTFGSYNFPTFNFADSCLVVGAILLIIGVLVDDAKDKKADMKKRQEAYEIQKAKSEEEQKSEGDEADLKDDRKNKND